ncbi:MAG: mycothiol conjugate amidase Mca [Propionibacteriaceae bacterium]|nr:mycothiol conjugate amidase Mca [Propionibacteriaceae bacterium]
MAMPNEQLRLVCAHAHPDDESSKGGAMMAMYAAQGVEVTVLTMTGGERGDVLNPALDTPQVRHNIAEVRRREMARASQILGVDHIWLGYEDSGFTLEQPWPPMPAGSLAAADIRESAARMAEILVRLRPQVLVTYDEAGGYPHPDHVMCHRVSMKALSYAADKERYADRAWVVPKVYYQMGFHRERFVALDQAAQAAGLASVYSGRLGNTVYDQMDHRVTTRVECGEFFELRDQALRAHATQIDPKGTFFMIPMDIQRAVWPTEDFELVRSTVPVSLPEDDLFAGLR